MPEEALTAVLIAVHLVQATAVHNMMPVADLSQHEAVLAAQSDTIEVPMSVALELGDFEVLLASVF